MRVDLGELVVIAGCAVALVTPDALADDEVVLERINESFVLERDGRYLEALVLIESIAEPGSYAQLVGERSGTLRAYMGDEVGAFEGFRASYAGDEVASVTNLEGEPFNPERAIEAIRILAADHQVVMINEAHNVSRHRDFTRRLIEALNEDGFTAFAAEGFAPNVSGQVASANGPTRTASAYVHDPFFAEMIERAVEAGMDLVPYEVRRDQRCQPDCSPQEYRWARELIQAQNLAAYFENNPSARMIVHVGYMHHAELVSANDPNRGYMGGHFTRLTGIDPLTIDQTHGTPRAHPPSRALNDHIQSTYGITESTVFYTSSGVAFSEARNIDLSVFHPEVGQMDGRPGWIFASSAREPVVLSSALLPDTLPLLVQARPVGANVDTIPVDQLLIETPSESFTLALPPGTYDLYVQRPEAENIRLEGPISVP
ncbi:hypothetical protein [Maricaulis sp.]|uniref:hypothetical protein n=1 Tax=Maricaulis sp. TaxID=1486257 RepID=UPI00262CA259|nr:hypothetical protein [Maricaulis sp.]